MKYTRNQNFKYITRTWKIIKDVSFTFYKTLSDAWTNKIHFLKRDAREEESKIDVIDFAFVLIGIFLLVLLIMVLFK